MLGKADEWRLISSSRSSLNRRLPYANSGITSRRILEPLGISGLTIDAVAAINSAGGSDTAWPFGGARRALESNPGFRDRSAAPVERRGRKGSSSRNPSSVLQRMDPNNERRGTDRQVGSAAKGYAEEIMGKNQIEAIVERWLTDEDFRTRMKAAPVATVTAEGFVLTQEERAALERMDFNKSDEELAQAANFA